MVRFAPTETDGQFLPYATVDGHTLHVTFHPYWVVDEDGEESKEYHIEECLVDGTTYPRVGNTCPGVYPDMTFEDDFPDDFVDPVHTPPRDKLYKPYIFHARAPAVLQPGYLLRSGPEDKLFARLASSGEDTGWIGMVGASSSASFPANGELMSLFFRSYGSPHDSVLGRNRLGDMWRSMLEYWLSEDVFDAAGNFDFNGVLRQIQDQPRKLFR